MKINISYDNLLDIVNIKYGVYYPLKKFVSKQDFLSITDKYRLKNNQFFPLPIFINLIKYVI